MRVRVPVEIHQLEKVLRSGGTQFLGMSRRAEVWSSLMERVSLHHNQASWQDIFAIRSCQQSLCVEIFLHKLSWHWAVASGGNQKLHRTLSRSNAQLELARCWEYRDVDHILRNFESSPVPCRIPICGQRGQRRRILPPKLICFDGVGACYL